MFYGAYLKFMELYNTPTSCYLYDLREKHYSYMDMKLCEISLSSVKKQLLNVRPSSSVTQVTYSSMGDHSQRTAKNFRQNVISDATVVKTMALSPSVVGLKLNVIDPTLTFFAGQWVDVFIPNISEVGGFSMHSPPVLLEQSRQIHLAVKKSLWPPAQWVHSSCQVGDKVQIRVGGDFYFDPPSNSSIPDLIFIAGGVGINPLLSIMLQLKYIFQTPTSKTYGPKNITLLYSAKRKEEILFQSAISELKEVLPESFSYDYFVTRDTCKNPINLEKFKERRITEEDLRKALNRSEMNNLIFFICGPPPMTDHFRSQLINMGVLPQQIKSEKWW